MIGPLSKQKLWPLSRFLASVSHSIMLERRTKWSIPEDNTQGRAFVAVILVFQVIYGLCVFSPAAAQHKRSIEAIMHVSRIIKHSKVGKRFRKR